MKTPPPPFIAQNYSLADHTYYKIGGIAHYFAMPTTIQEVQQALFWGQGQKLPCAILGSGSNSIYSDHNFNGLVISLEKLAHWYWETDEILYVEAGVTNTEVAEICLEAERQGASWMYRMPGQMGASIRMNARCYGGEISQIVSKILTINNEGHLKSYSSSEVFKGYKSTLLMNKPEIVIGARLSFPTKATCKSLLSHMLECEIDRHKKNHFLFPSCGSTFKNNYSVGKSSGQVFDELSLKGTSVGNASVSEYHANFIWNKGNASAHNVLTLAAQMRKKALKNLNADLELEVQPVGLFSDELYNDCKMQVLGSAFKEKKETKWVGLLWHPQFVSLHKNSQTNSKKELFPTEIFSCPFFSYFQKTDAASPKISAQVIQLQSLKNAKKFPNSPFLQWITKVHGDINFLFPLKPPLSINKFTNELWKFSVSEIFIADAQNTETYLEIEMTPSGEWIALEFNNIRQRSEINIEPNSKLWSGILLNELSICIEENSQEEHCTHNTFGMTFTYSALKKVFESNQSFFYIQCALSLGEEKYYLAPYWNKTHKADFHQPQLYWKTKLLN